MVDGAAPPLVYGEDGMTWFMLPVTACSLQGRLHLCNVVDLYSHYLKNGRFEGYIDMSGAVIPLVASSDAIFVD